MAVLVKGALLLVVLALVVCCICTTAEAVNINKGGDHEHANEQQHQPAKSKNIGSVKDGTAVHTTYHWHMEQPIYWPDKLPNNVVNYQKAWDSIQLETQQGGHPEDDLPSIFSDADRVAGYQYRMKDSVDSCSEAPDMGVSVSFSGCLIENINNLAAANQYGYVPGWNSTYNQGRQEKTSGGFPKMDFTSFPFHHALAPLVDKNALTKEIEIHKLIYEQTWGSTPGYSKGYFPAEMAFSERVIPTLVEQGIEWVLVANNHISRCCQNYSFSPSGDNCDPPNAADQINPPQQHWFRQSISRGVVPNNAYPYSYTPHYAKWVDPVTNNETKIVVVPAAMAMSWDDGYACYGTQDIQTISSQNNPEHPMLVVFAHDGDNDFGGGYTYYTQCVPSFVSEAIQNGLIPSTVQQYLNNFPVDPNDIVHVEDGAWVNADGDFGSPQMINWNWPLQNATGHFNIPEGWQLNERNWAVITAGENRVETAEQISGGVRIAQVQQPTSEATPAEVAWHFFLPSLDSGYMYYGAVLDHPVIQTVAINNAFYWADKVINSSQPSEDKTAPSIWAPQRLPWNPGAYGMGSLWGYKYTLMPRDFYVWTFIYDVSGLKNVTFFYRIDSDGVNPLEDNANEVFEPTVHGLSGVGAWQPIPMTYRQFPAANIFNWPNIDFFVMPQYIADEYWVHVTGLQDVLIDYYIYAEDNNGNSKNSDIFHVYID